MNRAMREEKEAEEQQQEPVAEGLSLPGSDLRRAIDLIASLISLSHSVKAFPAKWQSIRSKLQLLSSALLSAENCGSGENALFSGAIQSIFPTLVSCREQAARCISLSYSGKLLMQSDLDVSQANLARHFHEFNRICSSGILADACAIVVSKPAPGSALSDYRFYLKDLFTRLRIGDCRMKLQALNSLNQCLEEGPKIARTATETEDSISLLVSFLDFGELGIQEEAAKAISTLAGLDSCKGSLVDAIAPLIKVLEVGSELGREGASMALLNLTENSDYVWSVSAHGGVTILLKICREFSSNSRQLVSSACGILKNLSGVEDIRVILIEEGAISTFMKLSQSKEDSLQIHALELLQTIAAGDETARQMIVEGEGGLTNLVRILDPSSCSSSKSKELALREICNLCLPSPNSCKSIISHLGTEFLSRVLFYMKNGEISLQESAAKAAFRLAGVAQEARRAMGEVGFLPEFAKLLKSKSSGIQEQAGEAILNLISDPKNRKRFVQNDSNILLLLRLLDPENEKLGNKKILLAILLSLSGSCTARRKIAKSCYAKHLEKLADAGNSDAKRIIKKTSANKLRIIIGGIWSS